jgi:hypothetical protein
VVKADADWNFVTGTVEPIPETREIDDELYSVYRNLYSATRPMVHTIADLRTGGSESSAEVNSSVCAGALSLVVR